MCGIAGLFYPATPKPVDPARIRAMTDVLAHRGPDGSGVWTAPGVGFEHDTNAVVILGADGRRVEVPLASKAEIAAAVLDSVVAHRLRFPPIDT